jgi:hypothetical protein
MKFTTIILLLFSLSVVYGQNPARNEGMNIPRLYNNSINGFDFSLVTANIRKEKINTPKGEFYRLMSQGYGRSIADGLPEMPVFSRLIEIPADAEIVITIKSKIEETIDLNDIGIDNYLMPHQSSAMKSDVSNRPFVFNETEYRKNRFFSFPAVKAEYLGIMRNAHIARMTISPFSYIPVTGKLIIIKQISFSVRFVNGNLKKTTALKKAAPSKVNSFFINSSAFKTLIPVVNQYAETYVIVADSMFKKPLQPFIRMKERQGFHIIESYTQDTGVGNSTTSIKAYLSGLYTNATATNPAPTYALLVGDVSKIPTFTGLSAATHKTDLYYFEYTGDDFPELYYGRFSCDDTTELHNIIDKTLEYEQYLMPDPSYLDTAVLVAGFDNVHGSTYGNGQVNYGTINYYNSNHGIYAKAYHFPNSSNQAAQIRQDASDGVSMMNYSAHGSYLGWSSPSFKNSDIPNMTNAHKYNIMIANACLTGKYDAEDCFAEEQTNAAGKGAVGYIGASDNTYWDEDFYWAIGYSSISDTPTYAGSGQGIFDGIFHDHGESHNLWSLSLGQIVRKGNLAVTQGGTRVKYYWEIYHIFGDPSLVHYAFKPSLINAQYNPVLAIGLNHYNLKTEPYALVALSVNDSLVASAYADSTGDANLYFQAFMQPAQALLTITAQNKIPFTTPITVITPNGPYLAYNDYSINDSAGNNNGLANNGENIKLNMKIQNLTNFVSGGVKMILSSTDTNVIITDSVETKTLINGYDTINFVNAFSVNIKQGIEDGHIVKFTLDITDTAGGHWNSIFYMQLYAPLLMIGSMEMDDNLGNGNGIAEPGETVIFKVNVSNHGSQNAFNGTSLLTPASSIISGNTQVLTDTFFVDSSYVLSFSKVINQNAKTGDICKMDFNLTTTGYNLNKEFYAVIGKIDEDFETGDFSKFKWYSQKGNDWIIDSVNKYEGDFSARSASIGDDDTSSLIISLNVLSDDSISFYIRVSSELSYDYLYFFVDKMITGRWSGSRNWTQVKFPVSKGKHTLKWMYIKDYYGTAGYDAAWLDYIEFPQTDILSFVENSKVVLDNVKLYPNPATGFTNLIFSVKHNSRVRIVLFSQDGRPVKEILDNTFNKGGANSLTISTNELGQGVYYLVLSTDNQIVTKRLVILRK